MKNRWLFGKVTDYFDNRQHNSIYKYSEEIADLLQEEQDKIYQEISQRIIDYMELCVQNGDSLIKIAGSVADDVYRSMNSVVYYSFKQDAYLNATANTFFSYLSLKGLKVHYATNNSYNNDEALAFLFPMFYAACGIMYIAPHHIAKTLMEHDGIESDKYSINLKKYWEEALKIAYQLVNMGNEEGKHYALILPGLGKEAFTRMFDTIGKKGYLNLFKEADADKPDYLQYPYIG